MHKRFVTTAPSSPQNSHLHTYRYIHNFYIFVLLLSLLFFCLLLYYYTSPFFLLKFFCFFFIIQRTTTYNRHKIVFFATLKLFKIRITTLTTTTTTKNIWCLQSLISFQFLIEAPANQLTKQLFNNQR